jgi:hypothetical protein
MSVTVRDASLVTKRNRNIALNSYYTQWKDATVLSSNPKSATTGPAGAGAEVVAEIKLGCQACVARDNFGVIPNPDPNTELYPFNPSSGGASRNGPS